MPPIDAQTARVNDLLAKWKAHRAAFSNRIDIARSRPICIRCETPAGTAIRRFSPWPAHLIDGDDTVMAAVEHHYFLCRCWVGTGVFPAWQMRTMNMIYDMGKLAGVTPRHNPNRPTTPLTAVQMACKEAGIRDGESDLKKSGKSAPLIAKPPTY
jgi:hypothetical protein